jgi:hypothetical protein
VTIRLQTHWRQVNTSSILHARRQRGASAKFGLKGVRDMNTDARKTLLKIDAVIKEPVARIAASRYSSLDLCK